MLTPIHIIKKEYNIFKKKNVCTLEKQEEHFTCFGRGSSAFAH
jgi:hypothetical protein